MSSEALSAAVSDICTLITLSDKLRCCAQSRATVGEDLAQVIQFRTQARVLSLPDVSTRPKKVKRRVESVALSLLSSDGSVQRLGVTDLETSRTLKRSKIGVNLQEEINCINERFPETQSEIDHQWSEEVAAKGKEGLVVSCSYKAIAMEPNTTLWSGSYHRAFLPLRLLIPPLYPHCSPIVLEDHDSFFSSNNSLSCQARDAFKRTVRFLPQPVLLGDMVKAWDSSAHNALVDATILQGGGCFSSSYGLWDNFVNA